MPNWVKNKVRFENKEVIRDCYSKTNGEDDFDFNKIIPMPKSMHLTSGGNENISIVYAISKMNEDKKKEVINKLKEKKTNCLLYNNYYEKFFKNANYTYTEEDFEKANKELKEVISGKKEDFEKIDYKGLGIEDLQDLGNTYINNITEYGFDTWYDWSCENWGTKWGACHTYYIDENNIEFDSAWSMPYNIFQKISEKYETRVVVDFADEDIGSNCGTIIFENGNEIDFYEGSEYFAYKVWGYTDEEIREMRDEYYE